MNATIGLLIFVCLALLAACGVLYRAASRFYKLSTQLAHRADALDDVARRAFTFLVNAEPQLNFWHLDDDARGLCFKLAVALDDPVLVKHIGALHESAPWRMPYRDDRSLMADHRWN